MSGTVILVDDHPPLRSGVAAILSAAGYEVVAEAGSLAEAEQALASIEPDYLVTDISLPDGNGIDFIRQIRRDRPAIRAVVLTMHARRALAELALNAGADGYVLKESTAESLVAALRAAASGERFLDPRLDAAPGRLSTTPPGCSDPSIDVILSQLSGREFEVFRMLAVGRNSKEIGTALGVSPKTVDNHRAHIMEKLCLSGTADLVRLAVRVGVIEP